LVTESTKEDIADDPAHSEMTKPTETTSPRPVERMSATVGAMIWSTALGLNRLPLTAMICRCTVSTVLGPNQPPM